MSLTRIKPTAINQSDEFNLANLTVAGNVTATSFIGDGSQLTGISSGGGVTSYNDLTDKPTIPTDINQLTDTNSLLSGGVTSYNDLTDKPTIPTDINQLTDTNNLLSGGVTSYNDLTDKPTIPNDLTDLGITDGSAGQVLSTDGQGNFSFTTINSGSAGDSTTYYVKRSTNTSISYPGSYTPATIDYEDAGDNYGSADAMWSSATKRFTPTVPGLWYFRASIDCYPGASSEGGINITKNGTVVAQVSDIGAIRMEVTAHVNMNGSTDYVQFAGYTQGVTTRAQTNSMSWFEARLVSGTVSNLADLSVTTNAAGVSALSYNDVTGTFTYTPPDLSGYSTFSGSYTDLTSKPTIPTDVNDLTDVDNLLSSGGVTSYNDLTDKPTIPTDISQLTDSTSLLHPTVSYNDLTDTPTIPSDINQLTDSTNLLNPTIDYADLTGKPTIPTDVNDLTDVDNLLSSGGVTSYNDLTDKPTIPTDISQLTDSTNLLNPTISYNDLTDTPTIPSIAGLASETYVNTQISNLVDAAPGTLDTLNELAAALGDDPSFATTISTTLSMKANTADFSSVAFSGSYLDLLSKPILFSGMYDDLIGAPSIPTDINQLTDIDNLLSSGSVDSISNGTSNVVAFPTTVNVSVDGVANVVEITSSQISLNVPLVTGTGGGGNIIGANVISANYFIGNGALLTGLSGSGIYTDNDVAVFLPAYTGNITANNITANYFIGNGSQLTAINASTLNGHADTYFATSSQGSLADSAVQPGDNVSDLTNDSGFITSTALSGYATETYVNSAISTLVDAAPTVLDTLGELANALGNDASYATTVTNALATKLNISDFDTTSDTWLATKSTSDVAEGTNLYFTTDRANTAIDTLVTKSYIDALGIAAATVSTVNGGDVTGQVANSLVAGTVYTNAQPHITSLGTLESLTVTGTIISTTGVKTANIIDTTGTVTIQTKYNDNIGDVGVLGNLIVGTSGAGNISANNITGTITTNAQPNITSVGTLTSLTVSGLTNLTQTSETLVPLTGATGTVTHDFSLGSIFFHTNMSADFTANFTNVPTTADRTLVVGLLLIQGSTPYYASALKINNTDVTIFWANGTAPTPNSNGKDVQTFTLVRTNNTWYVYGNFTKYN